MQSMHITCTHSYLLTLVQVLEARCAAHPEVSTILDYGYTQKRIHGYIVIAWFHEIDEAFVAQLEADPVILDYSIYGADLLTEELFLVLEQAVGGSV